MLADGRQGRFQFLAIGAAGGRLSVTVNRYHRLRIRVDSDFLPEDTLAPIGREPPLIHIALKTLRGRGTGGCPPFREYTLTIGKHTIRQRNQGESRIIA